jgi:hypothetical protein
VIAPLWVIDTVPPAAYEEQAPGRSGPGACVSILFDACLLMPSAVSMVDARARPT